MQFQVSTLLLVATAFAPSVLAFPTCDQVSMALVETNYTVQTRGSESTTQQVYCNLNLHYCGWNLINSFSADYHTRISNKLCKLIGDCNYNSGNIWNSLWNCGADLEFLGLCGGDYSCQDGGAGRNDYCKAS
ncbi:Cupredoxin protein [Rutstroemia sp. NJR-2017a BBW]|nr:Cupredoxin protein [Rutstroemia sp. NJR-2017a BBW]